MVSPKDRVLLVYPPSRTQWHLSCPMGLMILGAVLEKNGYEVELLDANAAGRRQSVEQIVELAREWRPDVIGMTLLTPLMKQAYPLAEGLRKLGIPLLAGGPHATLLPGEPLEHGFDATVVGEGEDTVVEAVEALLGRRAKATVKGLAYRDEQERVQMTEARPLRDNLDTLPLPARHLVHEADYGPMGDWPMRAYLFSSRGCPGRCAFCSGGLFGKHFRFRTAGSIVEEIKQLQTAYGTKHFSFVDDAMTVDRKRIKEFCDAVIEQGLEIKWTVMTRIDLVDEELLSRMALAGCYQVEYGVESGHAETLKKIHKPHTREIVLQKVPLTIRYGMRPFAFFILGFPWEDAAALEDTHSLMKELAKSVECFHPAIGAILIPFPGTEIYEKYKEEYGFANWWLGDERNFDAPRRDRHSYFDSCVFTLGAVLDADFFRYTPAVKRKIREIFKFMYVHNMAQIQATSAKQAVKCNVRRVLLEISEKLFLISPRLERVVFLSIRKMQRVLGKPVLLP
jgi:anaerobic magnesium-protoporphyrin IX monomethyl ester cyclase